MALKITADGDGVRIAVKVVPGAARDRIAGVLGDALKIQVAAPPEGGRANARVAEVLAQALGVPTRDVQVVTGHGSPRKTVAVRGVTPAQVSGLFPS